MTYETPARRWLRRTTTGLTTAGLMLVAVPAVVAENPHAGHAHRVVAGPDAPTTAELRMVGHKKPHPNRKIKKYRVRPGDTPSELAVRFHAWTAQLIRINHTSTLYAGQVILIPVVVKAARECEKHKHHKTGFKAGPKKKSTKAKPDRGGHHHDKDRKKPKKKPSKKPQKGRADHQHPGWGQEHASRAKVRRIIIAKAERYDVNPNLALAIAWQESGWQQHRVSSAGALGAMQVMPGTGRWMSLLVGRRLHLKHLHDNVTAGTVLIKTLRAQAGLKTAVAGYYQGLAGVRRHGMYPSTKRYTANVLHLKKKIAHGWNPA